MRRQMRYIQTEVDPDLYARLLGIARASNTSLKKQVRRALEEFVKNHEGEVEKDSVLTLVGSFETKEGDWSERGDWRP